MIDLSQLTPLLAGNTPPDPSQGAGQDPSQNPGIIGSLIQQATQIAQNAGPGVQGAVSTGNNPAQVTDTTNKTSPDSDTTPGPMDASVVRDNEKKFTDKYEKMTGQKLHAQYDDIPLSDGTSYKGLAYNINGHNYFPGVHGPDWAFDNPGKVSQIPSQQHVIDGHFIPGTPTAAGFMGLINQGAANIAGQAGIPPNSNASSNGPIMQETPPIQIGNGNNPNGDPTAGQQYANTPGGTPNPAGAPTTDATTSPPQVDNSSILDVPGNGGTVSVDQSADNNSTVGGDTTTDGNTATTGSGKYDTNKMMADLYTQGSGSDKLYADAAAKRRDATTSGIPDVASLEFGGTGAILSALAVLAAGRNAAPLVGGIFGGIQQARQYQQDINNKVAAMRAAGKNKEADEIEKQAKSLDDQFYRKIQAANYIGNNQQKQAELQAKNDRAQANVVAKMRGQDLTFMGKLSPQGRYQWAIDQGLGEETAQAISAMRPDEIDKMSQASMRDSEGKYLDAKTLTENALRQGKQDYLNAGTDLRKQQAIESTSRAGLNDVLSDLDQKKVDWFDKTASADINAKNAAADASAARAKAATTNYFDANGNLVADPKLAAKQIGTISKAKVDADAALAGQNQLLNGLQAQHDKLTGILNGPPPADWSSPEAVARNNAAKQLAKLNDQIRKVSASVATAQAKSDGYGQMINNIQGANKNMDAQEQAYRQRMQSALPKLSPTDQAAAKAAFKSKFGKDY